MSVSSTHVSEVSPDKHAAALKVVPPPESAAYKGADVLSTLNSDGSRRWINPKPAPGGWWTKRRVVAWILIALFTAIPHLTMNGKPLILLDLTTRRFTFFGTTFLPTDTLPLALLFLTIFVTVFLATALFGRVWCGWACPQTVYMEFLYRPIERLFEGTPGRVRTNAFQGSVPAKVMKYAAFFAASCLLAHTFLAYFVGVDKLYEWVQRSPFEHPASFLVMAVVTGLMMFDFSFFREQTCLVACPYGRMQSVLLDRHSLIVSYDPRRGEPRGRRGKRRASGAGTLTDEPATVSLKVLPTPAIAAQATGSDAELGDCVDCGMCVTCCPTGIDIRNGLQMECVQCTQCIDACDSVMTKLKKPTGLIRYSSQAIIGGEAKKMLRPRVVIYPTLLLILVAAFSLVLIARGTADVTILRGAGSPFVMMSDELVGNQVKVKIANLGETPATYSFRLAEIDGKPAEMGEIRSEDNPVLVQGGETRTVPALIVIPLSTFSKGELRIKLAVTDGKEFSALLPFRMLGPGSIHNHSSPKATPSESQVKSGTETNEPTPTGTSESPAQEHGKESSR